MDERRNNIKELEEKKRVDNEARNRLLEGLGEAMFQRIGEDDHFPGDSGDTPGGILTEYRKKQEDIAESEDLIKSLEADIQRLKELEGEISSRDEEYSRLSEELSQVYTQLGKSLLEDPDLDEFTEVFRQQEQSLLSKIDDQEKKLGTLEEQQGGILAWLGKNAQMAVSKALLSKNRSALERVYRNTGEKTFSADLIERLDGEALEIASNARQLKEVLSSVNAVLADLKGERRKMSELFSNEGSPSRRIQGLEKHIAHVKNEFRGIYLRFSSLAAESGGRETLSSLLREEDEPALEKAELLKAQIAEKDLKIEKIKAAIKIDEEKAEIEKMNKAILGQRQKIASAEDAITGLEKQIAESEGRIEDLNAFLRENQ